MRVMMMLLVLTVASPAMAFEGEIHAKTIGASQGSGTMRITVSKKGDVRMETSAKSGGKSHSATILKPATGKYNYTVDHTRKIAMKVPKDMLDRMTEKASKNSEDFSKANVEIKKLGKEKVAGHMTRHIRVIDKDDGNVSDLWLSDKYPADLWAQMFTLGTKGPSEQMKQWNKAAKKLGFKPGFVIKMMHKGKDAQGGIEITKITKRKVSKSDFMPPAGYKIMEAPPMPMGAGDMKMPTTREEAMKMRDEMMKKMKEMQKQR